MEVKYSEYVYGLRGVSLSIHKGDFVFFLGQTGSGKSTLLKLVSKEVRPTAGHVNLWGKDLGTIPDREVPMLRRQMGIVPQDYGLLPRKRVYENVAYAMRAIGATRKEVRARVPEILERVHIGHRADAFPHQLSGGEQQRVAIGRALINNPPILLADEPTGNLDPEHSWEIMELLLELNVRGTTILVASHDVMVVERVGRRVVTMQQGRVVDDHQLEGSVLHPVADKIPLDVPAEVEAAVDEVDLSAQAEAEVSALAALMGPPPDEPEPVHEEAPPEPDILTEAYEFDEETLFAGPPEPVHQEPLPALDPQDPVEEPNA